MQVDAGQLRIVVQHLLKVGGTIRYGWHGTDGSVGLGHWEPKIVVRAVLWPLSGPLWQSLR
jgi:hypothetical protein